MSLLFFILVVTTAIVASILANKLTIIAAITGGGISTAIYFGVGWVGIALLGSFFLFGTIATSHHKSAKEKIGIAQENKGRRNAGQVLANGGVSGLLALLAIFYPQHSAAFLLMIAGSFSSATADTLSSELGSIYGKRFYDILSFKKGSRGSDGVVSAEGFLFGLAGSAVIAAIYSIAEGWSIFFLWLLIAGATGNIADSILGATLERKGLLKNDAVNFINTAVGAAFMLLVTR